MAASPSGSPPAAPQICPLGPAGHNGGYRSIGPVRGIVQDGQARGRLPPQEFKRQNLDKEMPLAEISSLKQPLQLQEGGILLTHPQGRGHSLHPPFEPIILQHRLD